MWVFACAGWRTILATCRRRVARREPWPRAVTPSSNEQPQNLSKAMIMTGALRGQRGTCELCWLKMPIEFECRLVGKIAFAPSGCSTLMQRVGPIPARIEQLAFAENARPSRK